MQITIRTIPHRKQRYDTCGDWVFRRGKLSKIFVSEMGNDHYAFLVGIHELIEAWLCAKNGVSQKEADTFDRNYEKARKKRAVAPCGCKPTKHSEPGNDPHAPYRDFHRFATKIERMIAKKLNINWKKYEKNIDTL